MSSLCDSSDQKSYTENIREPDTLHSIAQRALETYPVCDEMLGVSNASVQVRCLYSGPARETGDEGAVREKQELVKLR